MKKKMSLHEKAEAALREAVHEVVERRKKEGKKLSIWKDGKAVRILLPCAAKNKG